MSLPFSPHRLFNNQHWQQCYVSWLTSIYESGSQSPETAKNYNTCCRAFFVDPGKKPDQYKSEDVRIFINQLTKFGKSPAPGTRNARMDVLSSFYNYARECYEIEFRGKSRPLLQSRNPCDGIKRVEAPDPERDMTLEEMRRFMAAIPHETLLGKRDRTIFLWLLYTSRRRNEVLLLRWRDLEQIDENKWVYCWKGKGRMTKESAELPAPVVTALREYLVAAGMWGHMQPETPLFQGSKSGQPMNPKTLNWAFRKYASLAGLPSSLCPHAIRHLAAWERHELNGGNLLETAKYLGHRSTATTERYLKRPRQKGHADPLADALAAKYRDL